MIVRMCVCMYIHSKNIDNASRNFDARLNGEFRAPGVFIRPRGCLYIISC